ncbi:MAG: ABC transporter permease [Oscillospiraceae bacterium]|nr:ABC transporter permease [Oscillospiraceae bacterium]
MQAFNLAFKILKKNLGAVCMYFGIFFTMVILMTKFNSTDAFTTTKLTIAVRDLDNTAASQTLVEWIGENHEVADADFEDEDSLLAKLYYGEVAYAITIDKGFSEKLANGETDGLFTVSTSPVSYTTAFFDSQLRSFVSNVNCYVAGGFDVDEAVSKTAQSVTAAADINSLDGNEESPDAFEYYRFLGFVLIVIMISALSAVLMTMFKKEVLARTYCSTVSDTKYVMQVILACSVIALGIWLFIVVTSMAFDSQTVFSKTGALIIINSFVYMIISVEISVIIALLVKSRSAVDMCSNVIGLGMGFLCGVFVPSFMMDESVLMVGRFFPAFWYNRALEIATSSYEQIYDAKEFVTCVGVELLFIVALMAAILVVIRSKRQQKSL